MQPEILEGYIREALSPFEPGRIEVFTEEQWHNRSVRLGVRCQALKSSPLEIDIPSSLLDETPMSMWTHVIGDLVRQHIQNTPIIPTESHHILGEN